MSKPFKFKYFKIEQDRCAMKIGTDGVLLGAWTSLQSQPNSILDIGAGTGLIALQMAQRSDAELIDALEIDANAYEQCVENFEQSPWGDRLFCYHADFEEFVEELDETYELIVTNPPFYTEEVSSGRVSRDIARQLNSLPFEVLINGVNKLLADNGEFATIIPVKQEQFFIQLASKYKLFPFRITRVKGNPDAPIKRSLMQFKRKAVVVVEAELLIETKRHSYTNEYISLTKDFYLKM